MYFKLDYDSYVNPFNGIMVLYNNKITRFPFSFGKLREVSINIANTLFPDVNNNVIKIKIYNFLKTMNLSDDSYQELK